VRIAIFDYKVVRTNPSGGCHLTLVEGLRNEHEFTVFAAEFDNPDPARIRWVRIPVPTRPLVALFVLFHLVAPVVYVLHRIAHRARFDLVQHVEDNLAFGDVAYVHFCHRHFLDNVWAGIGARGVRGALRWLDHRLHAALEPPVYRRARAFVVPSAGLRSELSEEFPWTSERTVLIANPIDVDRFSKPPDFDRVASRDELGFAGDDVVLAFTALGQFERKGLPAILTALAELPKRVRLLVVGGRPDLLRAYRRSATVLGVEDRVVFTGMVSDPRRYLWSADAFVFPSFYEVFSLSAHEAAASGLPAIVTRLHGVTDVFEDGRSAIFVEPDAESVGAGVRRFLGMTDLERSAMSGRARDSVHDFSPEVFVDRWRAFYAGRAASAT
jgi:glycosyltransferase involved in cell wall biosynthesis